MSFRENVKLKRDGRNPSTEQAFSKACRKRWRMLDLATGSPTPPMRINSASGEFRKKSWSLNHAPVCGCARGYEYVARVGWTYCHLVL